MGGAPFLENTCSRILIECQVVNFTLTSVGSDEISKPKLPGGKGFTAGFDHRLSAIYSVPHNRRGSSPHTYLPTVYSVLGFIAIGIEKFMISSDKERNE